MKHILILGFTLILFGCKNDIKVETPTAQHIVDKAIEVSGGEKIKKSVIRFNFRDKYYVARRDNGKFSLIRMSKEGQDSIFDLLTNDDFERFINNRGVRLNDSMKSKYSASVNSVHYFSVLPYGLNDKAVNKTLLGEERINEKTYYKIKVTFDEDGGGEDYEDIFLYWMNKENFKVDYLAYSYNEADGKGLRFREAYNVRYVNGLRFVDYKNYKPKVSSITLNDLGKAFNKEDLELLSKIELKDIEVDLLDL